MTKNLKTAGSINPSSAAGGPKTKAAKARLLLNLIKTGAIPPPSAEFILELSQQAKADSEPDGTAPGAILRSLNAHLNTQPVAPSNISKTPAQSSPTESSAKTPAAAKSQELPPAAGPVRIDNLAEQHPAVIYREIGKLSQNDLKQKLKTLPGKTARQVAYLSWQRS